MKKSPNAVDRFVGERIKVRRQQIGLNQGQLAGPLGVTYQQIQKYEAGNSRIGAGRLQQIATLLKVPISYFFEGAPSISPVRPNNKNAGELPDYATSFIASEEGRAIARAFGEIEDRRIKDCITNLIEYVAAARTGK